MLKIFKIIIFIIPLILIFSFVVYESPSPGEQKKEIAIEPVLSEAEKILNNLTLEQKIGQLFLIGLEGKEMTPKIKELINSLHPGGVLLLGRNIKNEGQLEGLIQSLQGVAKEDTGLPLFVAVDQEGEPMCRINFLKEKTSQSKIKDAKKAYEIGLSRGKELREVGINLNLAPVLDIVQPGDFLFERSFKKDSQLTGELAKALISGQKQAGLLTAIKHFPGYGGIPFNPERAQLPILFQIPEVEQFSKALEAGPEMLMTTNVIYSEIDDNFPFSLSPKGIQFLRENLTNDFLIISDDLSSPVLKEKFSLKNTVILASKAGVDIFIVAGFDEPQDPSDAFNFLLGAVKGNEVPQERIDQSVLKIIKLKEKLLK